MILTPDGYVKSNDRGAAKFGYDVLRTPDR